ncbi:MAG: DMT family transporter, partial [Hyphomicrobiales bacterium]|nr:DMT family transporter [Hyphomicrobiales bacterium]
PLCGNGIGPLVQSLLEGLKANAALRGILLMCTAAILFPFMNGTAKYLGTKYPMEEVIWIRILSHLVFVSFLFVPRYGWGIVRSKRLKTQLSASTMLFLSTYLFFKSVDIIPLAEATAITFVGPLMVTVLAVPMLGEKTSLFRIICVVCGFMGALLVIRPGSDVFQAGSLLVVLSALLYSLYQITTGTLAGFDRPETSAIYSGIVGSLVMRMGSLGVIGGLGHYFVARALRITKASVIAPFHYLQIIFAVFYGYLVFNNLPDLLTVAGGAIIAIAGIAICWLEIKASKPDQA